MPGGHLFYQSRVSDGGSYRAKLVPLDHLEDKEILQIAETPELVNEEEGLKHLSTKEWRALQDKLEDFGWTKEEIDQRAKASTWKDFPKRDFVVTPKDLREKRVVLALLRIIVM